MNFLGPIVLACVLSGCATAPSSIDTSLSSIDINDQPIDSVIRQANQESEDAIHALCYRYKYGYHAPLDYAQAMTWCTRGAYLDLASSETLLAEMYEYGEGTRLDLQAARHWYEQAAAHGHKHALLALYFIYNYGKGVPVDKALARKYLNASADAGYIKAIKIRDAKDD